MNKKAQVTLFILLGLVLLGAAVGFYMFSEKNIEKRTDIDVTVSQQVPAILNPLKVHIESCLETALKKGIKNVGHFGGYTDGDQFFVNQFSPTEGNAIPFHTGSEYAVPYWFHMESDNECTTQCKFSSDLIRPLCKSGSQNCFLVGDNSVEEAIEVFVEDEAWKCFDFTSFEEQGYEIDILDNLSVTTQIREAPSLDSAGTVSLTATLPLEVKRNDQDFEIGYFKVQTPSNIYTLYEAGVNLASYPCLFESHIMRAISLRSAGSDLNDDFPPTYNFRIDIKKKFWIKPSVEQKVSTLTNFKIQDVGIFNTSSFHWPYTACYEDGMDCEENMECCIRQASADQNVFYPMKKYYPVNVNLHHSLSWRPYFDILPSDGALIEPSNFKAPDAPSPMDFIAGMLSSIFQMKEYRFYYMYSFPVIVELESDNKFAGKEYLRFALEANIRANQCFSRGFDFSIESETGLPPLLCDKTQGRNMTITVVSEKNSSQRIAGVSIAAFTGDSCKIGNTNASGVLKDRFPVAFGSWLVFEHDDYVKKYVYEEDFDEEMTVKLRELYERNVSIKIIDEDLKSSLTGMQPRDMREMRRKKSKEPEPEDTILITIQRIPESYQDGSYKTYVSYMDGTMRPDTVKLAEGLYEVKGLLIREENLTLPEEKNRLCVEKAISIYGCKKEPVSPTCSPRGSSEADFRNSDCYIEGYKCVGNSWGKSCEADEPVIFPSQSLAMYPAGGALLSNETAFWQINDYNIFKRNVTIFLFRQYKPTRMHHLEDLTIYEEYSKTHWPQINPEII